ncbi:MAG TPA: transcription repressor NadR, partial [Chloroflexota bacterium]|nr:transcription repressor NadR [Chloroflexota bacterium]
PVSGHELAEQLGVSRQIIVQDFAILRATGHNILSTPRGYILPAAPANVRAVIASRHDRAHTAHELRLLVDHGIRVVDVIVEHPVYGELRGPLMIASREDVREFEERVLDGHVALLSELSDGLHLHTVEAPSEERLEKAREALRERGFLVE